MRHISVYKSKIIFILKFIFILGFAITTYKSHNRSYKLKEKKWNNILSINHNDISRIIFNKRMYRGKGYVNLIISEDIITIENRVYDIVKSISKSERNYIDYINENSDYLYFLEFYDKFDALALELIVYPSHNNSGNTIVFKPKKFQYGRNSEDLYQIFKDIELLYYF